VKQSHGDILLINPSDIWPLSLDTSDLIQEHFNRNRNIYLTCKLIRSNGECQRIAQGLPIGAALSRELWDRIGGFDERFTGYQHQDTDVQYRLTHHHVCQWIEDLQIVYMHLDQMGVPYRDGAVGYEASSALLLANDKDGIVRVNPNGWGGLPVRKVLDYEPT
jgi:hypothetical protein